MNRHYTHEQYGLHHTGYHHHHQPQQYQHPYPQHQGHHEHQSQHYDHHHHLPMHGTHIYDQCQQLMHRYVLAQTNDGKAHDGIIEHVDDQYLYLAIPDTAGDENRNNEDDSESATQNGEDARNISEAATPLDRQVPFGYTPGWHGGYPYHHHHYQPHWHRPRRRFQRFVLPLAAITALSLLPYY